MIARSIAVAALAAIAWLSAGPGSAGPTEPHGVVVLQGLDKVTARVAPITVSVDNETQFGTMLIKPRACFVSLPTEPPETAVFLEIRDARPNHQGNMLFSGWMYASSPGLSALEHPVYDVWLLECRRPLLPAVPLAIPSPIDPAPPSPNAKP